MINIISTIVVTTILFILNLLVVWCAISIVNFLLIPITLQVLGVAALLTIAGAIVLGMDA